MTDILRKAATHTSFILDCADRANILLAGDGPRANAAGILSSPHDYLRALAAARELIDKAITLHGTTSWPRASDYHAL